MGVLARAAVNPRTCCQNNISGVFFPKNILSGCIPVAFPLFAPLYVPVCDGISLENAA